MSGHDRASEGDRTGAGSAGDTGHPDGDASAPLRLLLVGETGSLDRAAFDRPVEVERVPPSAARDRLDDADCLVLADAVDAALAATARAAGLPTVRVVDDTPLATRVRGTLRRPGMAVGAADTEAVDWRLRAMDEAPVGISIADPSLPDNPLVYVNEGFERLTGYDRSEVLGRNCRFLQGPKTDPAQVTELARAIDEGEPTAVELRNYRADGEPFWNRVEVAPVREDDDVTAFVGFQTTVTERVEAERALADEHAALERVLDRVEGLLARVTEGVLQAGDRDAVERTLCRTLAGSDPYKSAWLAVPDIDGERLRPRDWGPESEPVPLDGSDPLARAYRTGEVTVGPVEGVHAALATTEATVFGVPLAYGGTTYGVCCVYATAHDSRERAILAALGRTAAAGIHATEGRRLLASETVVELELRVADPAPFPVAAASDGTAVEYHGATYRDGRLRALYVVGGDDGDGGNGGAVGAGAAVDRALSVGADLPEVAGVERLGPGRGGGALVAVEPVAGSLVPLVADHGATVRSLTADADGALVRVDLPTREGVRDLVRAVRERYDGVSVVGTRERDRAGGGDRVAALTDALTDRQLRAFRLAYLSGYFDSSRRTTGDELAAAMGISRSTFHQHLRAAERKVAAQLFEGGTDGVLDRIPD